MCRKMIITDPIDALEFGTKQPENPRPFLTAADLAAQHLEELRRTSAEMMDEIAADVFFGKTNF